MTLACLMYSSIVCWKHRSLPEEVFVPCSSPAPASLALVLFRPYALTTVSISLLGLLLVHGLLFLLV